MPGESDGEKIVNYKRVVDSVVANEVRILRVGQYGTEAMRATFAADPRLKSLTWFRMKCVLDDSGMLKSQIVIPVMDSSEGITQKYSAPVQLMDMMRAVGAERALGIKNSANILGEVFYADSRYSLFTQVADVIGHLRLVGDYKREGAKLRGFKQKLLPLCEQLDSAMLIDRIVAMSCDGVRHGPVRR